MTDNKPQLNISISIEHRHKQPDIEEIFADFDVQYGGYAHASFDDLPMQILIQVVGTGIVWDLLKLCIKKLFFKLKDQKKLQITVIDKDFMRYSVKPDMSVIVLIVPFSGKEEEFAHIENIDDLIEHLKKHKSTADQKDS